MNEFYVKVILDSISLVQIIFNDFQINSISLGQAIKHMIWFR
jgi:hypothetical protein